MKHTYRVTVWPVDGPAEIVELLASSAANAKRQVRRLWPGCLSSDPELVA